jgi:hypothetical protein
VSSQPIINIFRFTDVNLLADVALQRLSRKQVNARLTQTVGFDRFAWFTSEKEPSANPIGYLNNLQIIRITRWHRDRKGKSGHTADVTSAQDEEL